MEGGNGEVAKKQVGEGSYVGFHNYNGRGSGNKVKMLKGIRMLFNLIPIIPPKVICFLLKLNGHKWLGILPDFTWKVFHLLGGIKSHEIEIVAYMKYHLFYFLRKYPKNVNFTGGNGSHRKSHGFVNFLPSRTEEAGKRI